MGEKKEQKNDKNNDRGGEITVVDFPKEVKILGKISRVYIEGNELYQKLTFEDITDRENSKTTKNKTQYLVLPMKFENSVVEFVKVPFYKLKKKPKSKRIGSVNCQRINPSGETLQCAKLNKWSTEKSELLVRESGVSKSSDQPETSTSGRGKTADAEIIRMFQKQQQQKEEVTREEKSTQDENGNKFRLLPYLITTKDKNKKLFVKNSKFSN